MAGSGKQNEPHTRDAQVLHSLLVTRPYPEGEFPEKAGAAEAAIKRAYTKSPDRGLRPPGNGYWVALVE